MKAWRASHHLDVHDAWFLKKRPPD